MWQQLFDPLSILYLTYISIGHVEHTASVSTDGPTMLYFEVLTSYLALAIVVFD